MSKALLQIRANAIIDAKRERTVAIAAHNRNVYAAETQFKSELAKLMHVTLYDVYISDIPCRQSPTTTCVSISVQDQASACIYCNTF